MMVVIVLAGFFFGAASFGSIGGMVGGAFGWVLATVASLQARVGDMQGIEAELLDGHRDLRERLSLLENRVTANDGGGGQALDVEDFEPVASEPTKAPAVKVATPAPQTPPTGVAEPVQVRPISTAPQAGRTDGGGSREMSATEQVDDSTDYSTDYSSELDRFIGAIKGWLLGGNTVVRVGIIVLLVGVILLLKYAADNAMFPLEARLASAAGLGVVLVAFGFRLRASRPGFAVTLQGGGIAATYLVTYFAYAVYGLMSAPVAFTILAGIAVTAIVLALFQDAMVLVLIGQVFGFLAPIVAATVDGNHIVLFSYYLLLNAVIFVIAWMRAYRPLNLVGFIFTLAVGAAWGMERYSAGQFATTEPFVVAFFLLYVAIAVLYSLRHQTRGWVDSTLVFGAPLAFLSVQAKLVEGMPYAMAATTLGMAGLYLGLSRFIHARKQPALATMADAFFAISVACATLAVPYVFTDTGLSGAAWALEGAAAYWIAVRQKHAFGRFAGIALQVLGACAVLASFSEGPSGLPLFNTRMFGAILTAGSGLFVAWHSYRHRQALGDPVADGVQWLIAVATLLLMGAGFLDVDAHVPADYRPGAAMAVAAIIGLLLAVISRAGRWRPALYPSLLMHTLWIPALFFWHVAIDEPLLGAGGAVGWPLLLVSLVVTFKLSAPRCDDLSAGASEVELPVTRHHLGAIGWWSATTWLSVLWLDVFARWLEMPLDWSLAAIMATVAASLGLLVKGVASKFEDLGRDPTFFLSSVAGPLAVACAVGTLALTVRAGELSPLPYLPLLNPLDVAQLMAIWVFYRWGMARSAWVAEAPSASAAAVRFAAAGLLLVWFNTALARSVHHFDGVPFELEPLLGAVSLHMAVSISWCLIGLACTVWGSRKNLRTLWFVGGALLTAVVAKLFVIDLAALSTITKIATFLVVGVLLLAVGFFAPVPPAKPEENP